MSARYHHGDLRRVILDAAADVITTTGPASLSLRELARVAGVSHAAPAHHFGDKTGLLTALAIEGNELLAASLAEALNETAESGEPDFAELGVRYVRFARRYPAHFAVMFRADLHREDDPGLIAAKARTAGLLREGLTTLPEHRRGPDPALSTVAAWSIAHGFATLWNARNLDALSAAVLGRSAATEPDELFRAVAALLFQGGNGG
ncbi:TetR/AcrR family transcriptional regulator [Saccharomonospora sp. NPDC006951]